jgi:hypothetical protein
MMRDHVAEEILGTMTDEESGRIVVRARLDCGCILEKMVASQEIVAGPDGRRTLRGKWQCNIHRGGGRR